MGLDPELLKQIIETFKVELEEQLQLITTGLLQLEKPSLTMQERKTTIITIFRAAHTIKGAARSLGIDAVGAIAHQIESLFSSMQTNTINIDKALIDLCLQSVDKMRGAMHAFTQKEALDFDLAELIQQLTQALTSSDLPISQPKALVAEVETIEEVADKPSQEDQQQTIRVSINHIDRISALMEEMQVNKIAIEDHYADLAKLATETNQFAKIWQKILYIQKNNSEQNNPEVLQKLQHLGADSVTEITTASQSLEKNMHSRINELNVLSNTLQEEIRMLRLVPLANLFFTMPRYVRDLAHALHKQVELKVINDEVKIDKAVLEKLKDPIIHLLRNSMDHGIETPAERQAKGKSATGLIEISISEQDGEICIAMTDDGLGIDPQEVAEAAKKKQLVTQDELNKMNANDMIELVFKPGFSTKDIITEVSGRGVGLDIVKANITNLKGTVTIKSERHKGTTFFLRVPVTLTSERGLMIKCTQQNFVIPTSAVHRVLTLSAKNIFEVEGQQAIMDENHAVALHFLATILNLEQTALLEEDRLAIIILKNNRQSIALLVDDIIGEREIVIKPLQAPLMDFPCIAGGTLSGSHQVVMVLNPVDIMNMALQQHQSERVALRHDETQVMLRPHILLVDDSITTRSLEKNILESKNYQVTTAVNGKEAWDLLQNQTFSLLITDVNMPLMDGFTLTELVKKSEKLNELPVVIVTSLGSESEKKRGIEVGANAYIVKHEFESGALLQIVEQLI